MSSPSWLPQKRFGSSGAARCPSQPLWVSPLRVLCQLLEEREVHPHQPRGAVPLSPSSWGAQPIRDVLQPDPELQTAKFWNPREGSECALELFCRYLPPCPLLPKKGDTLGGGGGFPGMDLLIPSVRVSAGILEREKSL